MNKEKIFLNSLLLLFLLSISLLIRNFLTIKLEKHYSKIYTQDIKIYPDTILSNPEYKVVILNKDIKNKTIYLKDKHIYIFDGIICFTNTYLFCEKNAEVILLGLSYNSISIFNKKNFFIDVSKAKFFYMREINFIIFRNFTLCRNNEGSPIISIKKCNIEFFS